MSVSILVVDDDPVQRRLVSAAIERFGYRPVVVEGEVNAVSVMDLARRMDVAMPICEAVYQVLHAGADLRATFAHLWSQPIMGEPRTLDIVIDHPSGRSNVEDFAGVFA